MHGVASAATLVAALESTWLIGSSTASATGARELEGDRGGGGRTTVLQPGAQAPGGVRGSILERAALRLRGALKRRWLGLRRRLGLRGRPPWWLLLAGVGLRGCLAPRLLGLLPAALLPCLEEAALRESL